MAKIEGLDKDKYKAKPRPEPKQTSQDRAREAERLNRQWSEGHRPVTQSIKNKTGH